MTSKNTPKQLPLPGMTPPPLSEEFVAKIEAVEKLLTGEMRTLRKCWQVLQQLREGDAQSDLAILVTVELSQSELWATANRILSMCDQLKTLTSISTAYYLTSENDGAAYIPHPTLEDILTGMGFEKLE